MVHNGVRQCGLLCTSSAKVMQRLIVEASVYASQYYIVFNSSKSQMAVSGYTVDFSIGSYIMNEITYFGHIKINN